MPSLYKSKSHRLSLSNRILPNRIAIGNKLTKVMPLTQLPKDIIRILRSRIKNSLNNSIIKNKLHNKQGIIGLIHNSKPVAITQPTQISKVIHLQPLRKFPLLKRNRNLLINQYRGPDRAWLRPMLILLLYRAKRLNLNLKLRRMRKIKI